MVIVIALIMSIAKSVMSYIGNLPHYFCIDKIKIDET